MGQWSVAITRPHYEYLAEEHLRRQGFATYMPRFRARMVISGKLCWREQLLFRRYIFIEIADAWHAILRTLGIVSILRSGLNPAIVPEHVISELKSRDHNGFVRLPKFSVGQRVRIIDGPFAGRMGLYAGMDNREREAVLLNAMGCKLTLSQGSLVAV